MKSIIKTIVISATLFGAASLFGAAPVAPTTDIYVWDKGTTRGYWDDNTNWRWVDTSGVIQVPSPVIPPTSGVNIRLASATTATGGGLNLAASGEDVAGTSFTRDIDNMIIQFANGGSTALVYGSQSAGVKATLNVNNLFIGTGGLGGHLTIRQGVAAASLDIAINNLIFNQTSNNSINFGTSGAAANHLSSVTLDKIYFEAGNTGTNTIQFISVSKFVKFNSVFDLTKATVNFATPQNVFGDIKMAASTSATNQFGTVDLSALGSTSAPKIIFDGLDDFITNGEYTLLSWTTLNGTATASDILNNIIASNSAYVRSGDITSGFKLSDTSDSIIYTYSAIPEPAEIAALLGLIALGFAARRRSK